MTNREWLRSLTDEELANFFIDDRRSLYLFSQKTPTS